MGAWVLINDRWYYLFEDRYGRPGKGNDKGNVEGVVGYARRNFMTPLPRFASWDAFNGHLEEQCRNRQGNVLRGHRESIGERFVRDREALKRPLPAPFDACDKQGTRVNSLSLVRYRTNDYSVPVAYGHQEVWIRGYVHEVVIGCGAGIIARHPRSYDREDMVFDPIHYLPLLEHKIGALDQAAPLAGWELPDAFPTLRRLLEARMGKAGKREYVQVLRLVETFDLEVLHGAVKDALRLGAIGYDAVKHLVLCRIERRPPKLDLDIYPYLPRANVATTAAASYMTDIPHIPSKFVEIVPLSHRQGNCIPYAAIRWHDFGNRPALGRPLGHFSRHPDTPLLSLSPRRRFPRPTPERVFVADHQSSSGFSGTGPSAPPPQPIGT